MSDPLDPNITMVRGAHGTLYYMTPTGSLTRVPPADEIAWNNAIDNNVIQPALNAAFATAMQSVAASCHQHVQIVVPEIDLDLQVG